MRAALSRYPCCSPDFPCAGRRPWSILPGLPWLAPSVSCLNDAEEQITLPSGLAVLDLLRRERRLTGTREGCREGDCGACLVLLGEPAGPALRYRAVNSCLLPVGELAGRHLVTIEGLNPPGLAGPALNAIQQSFVDEGATQCGFCTPGFIVALTGHFLAGPDRDPERPWPRWPATCAAARATPPSGGRSDACWSSTGALPAGTPLERCVAWGVVPPWLREAPARLAALRSGRRGGTERAGGLSRPAAGRAGGRGHGPVRTAAARRSRTRP